MKSFLKKSWIAIVAAIAIVAGACCTHKNAPQNNEDPSNQEANEHKLSKRELKERLKEVQERIKEREMSCVYGSPEIIERYGQETRRLRHEADSLQKLIDNYDKP